MTLASPVPFFETRELGRQASDGQWLLQSIDLVIEAGERLAIVGPSGSGKTVLMRALALLDELQTGWLRLDGKEFAGADIPAYRASVQYVRQRPVLFEGSVLSNFEYPFSLASNREPRFDRKEMLDWLAQLNRDSKFLVKDERNLSGGESQIVALLRAMQLKPRMLMLDEPTASMDRETTRQVEQLLARWREAQERPPAIVWITHTENQAERISERILRLEAGSLSETDATGVEK